jgi:Tol biopolymer transport system component
LIDVSSDGSTLLVRSNVGGLTYAYPLWTVRTLGGSAHLLGKAENGAFSPDGNTVVYSTANSDLHIVGSDGTQDRNVGKAQGFCMSFSWSPDGKKIRFTSDNFTSDNSNGTRNDNALWEMSSSGANLHRVLPQWTADQTDGRWAQDGTFFFVSGSQIWAIPARHGLFASSTSQPLRVTAGPIRWGTPIPDRSGKIIYASGFTRRGELVHFDAQTHQFEPLLGGLSADSVSFSKDGKSVAYVSYPEGVLWKANADGSAPMQLSDNTVYPRSVAMSPDGAQVLFETSPPQGGYVRAWIVSTQGGVPRLLFPNDTGPDTTDPNWSPDSRKIVFAVSPEGGNDPKSEVRILDLDTNQITNVPGSTGMFSPHWSPDGRSIAALATSSIGINIFDIATQRWSTPFHKLAGFETWSKDSQWINFIEWQENPGVYRVRVTGGDAERIVDLHGVHYTGYFGVWMALDPNDDPMILRDIGTDDIYALTLGQHQ